MAMDNRHHLEGLLVSPRVFKVYLYDAYTKPLSKEEMAWASGTVQIGDSSNSPKVPLMLSVDGNTLEAHLENDVTPPCTFTLWLRFPNMPPTKPELFTFSFRKFSAYLSPS